MKTTKQKQRIDHRKAVMDWVYNQEWKHDRWKSEELVKNGRYYHIGVLRQNNVITTVSYQVKYNNRIYPYVTIANLLITDQHLADHRAAMQGGNGKDTAPVTTPPTAPVTEFTATYKDQKVFILEVDSEIERLKKEIEQLKKQAEINGKECAALQAEHVRVSQELKGYQKENGILKARLNDANDLIAGYQHRPQQAAQLTVEKQRLQAIYRTLGYDLPDRHVALLIPVINLYIATNGNPTLSQIIDALKGGGK